MDEPDRAKSDTLRGIPGSPGVAIGRVIVYGTRPKACPTRLIRPEDTELEFARFKAAVERLQADLRALAERVSESPIEPLMLESHIQMIGDDLLEQRVRAEIEQHQRCAEWALSVAATAIADQLRKLADPYLRERSNDVELVGQRILATLMNAAPDGSSLKPEGPTVIVAHDLSPADTAALVDSPVVGLITEIGSRTSHTAIMARALEIPAVLGLSNALGHIATGDLVIVDGLRGTVSVHPTPAELGEARARSERHGALSKALHSSRHRDAQTRDGVRVRLRANVELPSEAQLARDHGAEGIGLYRTEFLYVDRTAPPSEEEQLAVYRAVVETSAPHPVVLRTFDIGGDKFASSFPVPPEMNPMLGLRAVRLALSRPDVFLVQLRAMIRASHFGPVKIMVPMVASLTELRHVKVLMAEAYDQVRAGGYAFDPNIPLGVMIEVPSAAIMVEHFAREAAFLSLGTNDLIQYALAVDRTSRSLAYLASPFDPSILRLILGVVHAGRRSSCPVSICGAMASDPLAASLLVGLGLRDFSMEAAAIPEIKEALSRISEDEAEEIAREALELETAEEVEHSVAAALAPRLYDLLAGAR